MPEIRQTPEFIATQTTIQREVDCIATTAQRIDMFQSLVPFIKHFSSPGFVEVVPESEFATTYAQYQEQFTKIDPNQKEPLWQDVERFAQVKGAAILSDNDGYPQKVIITDSMACRYEPPVLTLILAEELGHMSTHRHERTPVENLRTPAEIRAKVAIENSEDSVVRTTRFVRSKGFGYYFENEKQQFIGHGMNEPLEELRAQIIAMYVVSHTMAEPNEKLHQGFLKFKQKAEDIQDVKAQILSQIAECLDWRNLIKICIQGSIDEFLAMIKSSKRSQELYFYIEQFIAAEGHEG